MTSVKEFQVTFDCADPERVALFWCDALGYVVPPPPDGFDSWDVFERTPQAVNRSSAHYAPPSLVFSSSAAWAAASRATGTRNGEQDT